MNSLQKPNQIFKWRAAPSVYRLGRGPNQEVQMRDDATLRIRDHSPESGLQTCVFPWGPWEAPESNNPEAKPSWQPSSRDRRWVRKLDPGLLSTALPVAWAYFYYPTFQCGIYHSRGNLKAPMPQIQVPCKVQRTSTLVVFNGIANEQWTMADSSEIIQSLFAFRKCLLYYLDQGRRQS